MKMIYLNDEQVKRFNKIQLILSLENGGYQPPRAVVNYMIEASLEKLKEQEAKLEKPNK